MSCRYNESRPLASIIYYFCIKLYEHEVILCCCVKLYYQLVFYKMDNIS